MEFKDQLRKLRLERGYSGEELGKMIGVSKAAIGNYESGYRRPRLEHIYLLAKVFNVSPAYLLGWEQEHFQYTYGAEENAQYTVKYEEQNELNAVYTRLSNCNQGKVVMYAKNLLAAQEMEEELKAANAKLPETPDL